MDWVNRILAAATVVAVAVAVVIWTSDGDDDAPGRDSASASNARPAPAGGGGDRVYEAPPAPRRCPPPGPAAYDPKTGRTLCGSEAKLYIDRLNGQQKRDVYNAYGFTPEKQRLARRVIAADPTLRKLLGGKRPHVARMGPWSQEGSHESVGVVAEIKAAPPIAATAVLPYVCTADPKLSRGKRGLRMSGVTRLDILVEFASESVVQIDPSSFSPSGRGPKPRLEMTFPHTVKCPDSGYD